MTAKEEANKLGNKFYKGSVFDYDKQGHIDECKRAKEIALICVDEILRILPFTDVKYWQEVKEEINKL
tara:strand:+ start:4417 stop:4620 length:204 start_codon:yes stop_codon:yes gene_type:complete